MAEHYFEQKLPESDTVLAGYLESMLANLSSSYKLYWFKGIFTEIMKGSRVLEYKRLVARMIGAAWYPVVYYKLNLGFSDKLADAVWYLHKELHIDREEKEEKIVSFICSCEDKKLMKMVKDFTNLVPFRLIRPFYQRELDYERKCDLSFHDGKVNNLIEKLNRLDTDNALYIMNKKNGILTVSQRWVEYLRLNAAVVEGWLNYKLIRYIQERNPNVPAVPFKIFPPADKDRNLGEANRFWNMIKGRMPLYDIYTHEEFEEKNYEVYGKFSIDHFIPWSFVLHNEIWNLYPMFCNINSSKNNKLPDKKKYLDQFCENQYKAFLLARQIPNLKKTTDQYLTVKKDIFSIKDSDRGHDAFLEAMKQTIEPLYQIANNQGYSVWRYL